MPPASAHAAVIHLSTAKTTQMQMPLHTMPQQSPVAMCGDPTILATWQPA